MPTFHLVADVSTDSPDRVRQVVGGRFPTGAAETATGFHIEAELTGESARDLNRDLLSALRREERRTRLRAAWTADGTTERFFDYVPKGSHPAR
jgi:hypothetical protein